MSIGSILNMARAGLNAQQTAIQIASQNISNATTEGYSKQRVELSPSLPTVFPYGSVGTGVDIKTVLTNTTHMGAYRGAGRPEANY